MKSINFKKVTAIILALTMSMGLVACGNKTTEEPVVTDSVVTEVENEENNVAKLEITEEEGTYVVVGKKSEAAWSAENISGLEEGQESPIAMTVEETEDEYKVTFSAVSEGSAKFELFGDNQFAASIYTFEITADANLKMVISYTEDFFEREVAPTFVLDEDVEVYTNELLVALGLEGALVSRMLDTANLDEMSAYFGSDVATEKLVGLEKASVSEPEINVSPFSAHVLKFDTAENAEAAANVLVENAQLNRWVCVSAEKAAAKVVDDVYVVFLMSTNDHATALADMFVAE